MARTTNWTKGNPARYVRRKQYETKLTSTGLGFRALGTLPDCVTVNLERATDAGAERAEIELEVNEVKAVYDMCRDFLQRHKLIP